MSFLYCACLAHTIYYTTTGECRTCYSARHHRENYSPTPRTIRHRTGQVGTYKAAHERLKTQRGRATDHQCTECSASAQEWSYRGGSTQEQQGYRTHYKRSRTKRTWSTWSGNPNDYDPLCIPCHRARDGQVKAA